MRIEYSNERHGDLIYRTTGYQSQSARDAKAQGYGTHHYWDYLERSALEKFYRETLRGRHDLAAHYITRSISEALRGNEGI